MDRSVNIPVNIYYIISFDGARTIVSFDGARTHIHTDTYVWTRAEKERERERMVESLFEHAGDDIY
jgi:hypothetical protein